MFGHYKNLPHFEHRLELPFLPEELCDVLIVVDFGVLTRVTVTFVVAVCRALIYLPPIQLLHYEPHHLYTYRLVHC